MQRLNICKLFRFFMEKVGKERAAFYEKGGAKPLHAPVPWQTARSISKIFFIIPEKNLLFSLIFFPILEKVFVTKFVTSVTNFVTKNISGIIKKERQGVKTLCLERKKLKGDIICLFLILLDTFCSYYLKR